MSGYLKAVKGMSSVMVFEPKDTEEDRYDKFSSWYERHAPERAEREFLGPQVPGPKETRKMLRQYQ